MRGRGVTLAEILVASGLILLVVGLFLPIWQIAMRTWQRGEEVQTVQRDTLALSYRLRSDYLASRPESMIVNTVPGSHTLLSLLSYEGVQNRETMWTATGEVLWRKWVQYQFVDAERRVRRREVALATASETPAEPVPAWSNSGAHTVGWNVAVFQVISPSNSLVLRLRIQSLKGNSSTSTSVAVIPRLYGLDVVSY